MKRLSASLLAPSFLALTAALAALPLSAHADNIPGWYAALGLGGTFTPDEDVRAPAGRGTVQYSPGWNVNGAGGYAFANGLRTEGEVFRSTANVDRLEGRSTHTGNLYNTDLFANLYYDFHTETKLTPYVGAGVGVAFVDGANIAPVPATTALNSTETELAYQGIVGVSARLDDHWSFTTDYRYIGTTDPKFKVSTGGSARTDNSSHNIIIGVRYNFAEPAPFIPVQAVKAPAPAPAAPVKPVVAPVPQSYMVFFDFNKSELTPEAKRIVASAAQDLQRGGTIRLMVTGHTDTVGSVSYNQKLSERRAASVQAELESLGVQPGMIRTNGAGKTGLLVPTADGVREAQNRRAEIVLEHGTDNQQ